LRNAYALLFPIDWAEPFGLVMIEAMACGTPTVAFRGGSVHEIIENGVTGYVVDSIEDSVRALKDLESFDRLRYRRAFEERFSARRMAQDYVETYRRIIENTRSRATHVRKNVAAVRKDAGVAVTSDRTNGRLLPVASVNLSE